MQRYGTMSFILIRQPRPGERESRYHAAPDRSMKRPKKEAQPHV